jgi:hypothetical protein
MEKIIWLGLTGGADLKLNSAEGKEAQMNEHELPKGIKKAMRALVGAAYEAELRRALEDVYKDFQEWKSGGIDSFELSDRIHKFHNGPNRELYLRYTSRLDPRFLIQSGLQEGAIEKSAVPKEVWPYLEGIPTLDGSSPKR